MALKERLVNADLLYPDNPFPGHELNNPIYEQEWVAVGQKFLDCLRVKNCFHNRNIKTRHAEQTPHRRVVKGSSLRRFTVGASRMR